MHDWIAQLVQVAGAVGIASLTGLAAAAGRHIWHATESIKDENKRRSAETGLAAVEQAATAGSSLLAQQGTLLGTILGAALSAAVNGAAAGSQGNAPATAAVTVGGGAAGTTHP